MSKTKPPKVIKPATTAMQNQPETQTLKPVDGSGTTDSNQDGQNGTVGENQGTGTEQASGAEKTNGQEGGDNTAQDPSTPVEGATSNTNEASGTEADADKGAESTEGSANEGAGDAAAQDTAAATDNIGEQLSGELLKPLTEVEQLVNKASADGDDSLKTVVRVCEAYRSEMQPNKITGKETIRTQQLAFFRMVREVLQSSGYYANGLSLTLQYMREDAESGGALSVPYMMRGFDDDTMASMTPENRQLFWAFVTLLTTAAGLNDPKQTYKKVSLKAFQSSSVLKADMKQRLVSFFSA